MYHAVAVTLIMVATAPTANVRVPVVVPPASVRVSVVIGTVQATVAPLTMEMVVPIGNATEPLAGIVTVCAAVEPVR